MRKLVIMAVAIAVCSFSGVARAIDFDFSGNFTYDNDIAGFNFATSGAGPVTIFSSSWLSGNPPAGFDPILAIWNMDVAGGTKVAEQDDGLVVGSTLSNAVLYNHGVWDSYFTVNLAAGNYRATIAQYSNFSVGPLLSQGFVYDGAANQNFTFTNGWGAQPYFNGVWDGSDGRTSRWEFHVLDVQSASNIVPEPTSIAILGLGLLGLAAAARRRKA